MVHHPHKMLAGIFEAERHSGVLPQLSLPPESSLFPILSTQLHLMKAWFKIQLTKHICFP
jgi:hypothetical protein